MGILALQRLFPTLTIQSWEAVVKKSTKPEDMPRIIEQMVKNSASKE
jgi:hypothetical protein